MIPPNPYHPLEQDSEPNRADPTTPIQREVLTTQRENITPGQPWLDTSGNAIHAHGGSIIEEDGTYYWFGEN